MTELTKEQIRESNRAADRETFEQCDKEYRVKSKTKYLILTDQVFNDGGGYLLVSMDNAHAITLRDKSEVKRLRSKLQPLRPIAMSDGWYFLQDALED